MPGHLKGKSGEIFVSSCSEASLPAAVVRIGKRWILCYHVSVLCTSLAEAIGHDRTDGLDAYHASYTLPRFGLKLNDLAAENLRTTTAMVRGWRSHSLQFAKKYGHSHHQTVESLTKLRAGLSKKSYPDLFKIISDTIERLKKFPLE